MGEVFRISVPLNNPTIRYHEEGEKAQVLVLKQVPLSEMKGAGWMFGKAVQPDAEVILVNRPATDYFGELMGNMMRPIQRFPTLLAHFSGYRVGCWLDESGEGGMRPIIVASLPSEVSFRTALLAALSEGRPTSIGFVARFADRDDAPLPSLAAFQAGHEPTFDASPVFWVHAQA